MAQLQGYCVKCKEKDRDMNDLKVETSQTKSGTTRYMARGTCSVCSTPMTKFLSADDGQRLQASA